MLYLYANPVNRNNLWMLFVVDGAKKHKLLTTWEKHISGIKKKQQKEKLVSVTYYLHNFTCI